jgi:hypothetical protein
LNVVEKRVANRAKSDFPTPEVLEGMDLSKLDMNKIHNQDINVFHKHLVSLNPKEYGHALDAYSEDNSSLVTLAQNIRQYGMKSLDSISPDDASKVVLDRIKARMYYETFKPEVKMGVKSAGLDSAECGLSM